MAVVMQIQLSDRNRAKLDVLARRTGRAADELANQLANEAIERVSDGYRPETTEPAAAVPEWKASLLQAAGMWKDRDDVPELVAQLRREWDRAAPPGEATA